MKPILVILCAIASTLIAAGQSASRLIGIAYYNAAPTLTFRDSVSYTYSGGRSGQLKIPMVLGDGAQWVAYHKGTPYTDISFDTSWEFYYPSRKKYNQYDADGKMAESGDIDMAGTKRNKTLYSYDNSGNLIQYYSQVWNDTFQTWNNTTRMLATYNNHNRIITQYHQWKPPIGLTITGKDSIAWAYNNPVYHIYWIMNPGDTMVSVYGNFHYDRLDRMDSCHLVFLPNSTYPTIEDQRYTYDGNNPVLYIDGNNHSGNYKIVSGVYDDYGNRLITIDSTPVYRQTYNPQIRANKYRTTITYNSYNQPLLQTLAYWDTASNVYVDEDVTKYYYETYIPNTGPHTQSAPVIRFMPNPAKDYLHFEVAWDATHQYTIAINDVAGRILATQGPINAEKFSSDIDLHPYCAGSYFLTVRDHGGKHWTERFVVIE